MTSGDMAEQSDAHLEEGSSQLGAAATAECQPERADCLRCTLRVLKPNGAAVRRLAFSPDGTRLASGSDDATARIWYLTDVAVIKIDGAVVGMSFSPDGRRLVVSSAVGTLYVVDAETGAILR